MRAVHVHTSQRDYDVLVCPGALSLLGASLLPLGPTGRAVLVTDHNVWPLYGAAVREQTRRAKFSAAPGEASDASRSAHDAGRQGQRVGKGFHLLQERSIESVCRPDPR